MSSSSQMTPESETIRNAAAGLSAHLVYQVSARLFSFIIKAIVVRALRPAQYAFAEIRVVLLVNLALLPAIHGFRPVTVRLRDDNRAAALAQFNSLITCVLGVILGLIAIILDRENAIALIIVLISVLIRAFVEIPVVFLRRRQMFKEASRARAISIVISGISQTVAVSVITRQSLASPASSAGHVAYVLAMGWTMTSALGLSQIPSLSLKSMQKNLLREDLSMVAVATGEGVIKFLLENGEAIVLDITCAPLVKGAYKIAANLGSVFARFFSEALEEQAFNVFSRLSPSFSPSDSQYGDNVQSKQMRETCIDMLILGLKSALTVALVFATIGPSFSYALIRLLYGAEWADETNAPAILSAYLIYIMFMAGNGVSEAFVSASASTAQLKSRTKFTTALSAAYMILLYQMATTYGANGVIFANCVNMTMRTMYSCWFFTTFTNTPVTALLKALPNAGVVFMLLASRVFTSWSEHTFLGPSSDRIPFEHQWHMLITVSQHAVSGVLALVLFAIALRTFESGFIRRIRQLRMHQHDD